MGGDCDSWLYQQHFPGQSPNWNCTSTSIPPDQWIQNTFAPNIDPCTHMVSANGANTVSANWANMVSANRANMLSANEALQGIAVSELPQANESHGWFYCLPRYRQAVTPTSNSVLKERFPTLPYGASGVTTSNAVSEFVQKGFLVFDQSENQTSLIFRSAIGHPFQHSGYWTPEPLAANGLPEEEPGTKRVPICQTGPILSDGLNENHENSEESEMHEDTEELNALLDSDDDYEVGDDDEETSTGHSPSEMTRYEKQEKAVGSTEEVASSGRPIKRQRLNDGEHDASSLLDTASSVKLNESSEYEDDAESSCTKGKTQGGGELGSLWGSNKCLKRERIQETVSILQKIVPGGKDKDAVLVLDEAIQYLTYLKLKAKDLGVTTL